MSSGVSPTRRTYVVTALVPTTAPAAVAALTTLLAELGPGLDDDVAVLAISVPARRPT
jgi:sigma-B regulation protein RsbU (phosphoserine phosphatase)